MNYDDDITPAGVAVAFARWWWIGAIALAGLGALILSGWQAGWWFTNQNAQRTAHLVQSNYNTQEGYLTAIEQDVAAIDANVAAAGSSGGAGLLAQNIHSGDDACSHWMLVIPGEIQVPVSLSKWAKANCSAGALVPGSSIYKGGNGE